MWCGWLCFLTVGHKRLCVYAPVKHVAQFVQIACEFRHTCRIPLFEPIHSHNEELKVFANPKLRILIYYPAEIFCYPLGIKQGRPLIRVQYRGRNGEPGAGEDKRLDALYLICRVLEKHISNLYTKIETEKSMVYLRRKTNGSPDALALEEGKRWNLRLLDRNFNGVIAADPWTRRKSMRNRIAIIKTLWDISTNLRARRMKDMLLPKKS